MKLSELKIQAEENRQGRIKFSSITDRKFYNKYKDRDYIICYSKKENFPRSLWVIIQTNKDKFYGLKINNYNKFSIIGLKEAYREIEKYGINIIDKKEIGNVRKQMILEALERSNGKKLR